MIISTQWKRYILNSIAELARIKKPNQRMIHAVHVWQIHLIYILISQCFTKVKERTMLKKIMMKDEFPRVAKNASLIILLGLLVDIIGNYSRWYTAFGGEDVFFIVCIFMSCLYFYDKLIRKELQWRTEYTYGCWLY